MTAESGDREAAADVELLNDQELLDRLRDLDRELAECSAVVRRELDLLEAIARRRA